MCVFEAVTHERNRERGMALVEEMVTSTEIEAGQFFVGLRPGRANAQAYDREARAQMKRLSEELTGLR